MHCMDKKKLSEEAELFFADLLSVYSFAPDFRRVYEEFGRIFSVFLLRNTEFAGVGFSGPFARTSYLLKEHGASAKQARMVNGMRTRLRRRAEMSTDELKEGCLYDLKALAVFGSIVYSVNIPRELLRLFPVERVGQSHGYVLADVLRIIINSIDDECFYGTADDEEGHDVKVCYAHGNTRYDYDWTYLREYVCEGTRLNLVRPRLEGGTVYPELIIYEPDVLIDISAIARCFQDYGTTPLNYLLNKISPQTSSPAMVLGNLAGQFLDEEVNKRPEENRFNDSIREFYSTNPLGLVTSGIADNPAAFYEEARKQKENIRRAIRESLPLVAGRFNPRSVILEPSFFSEMLGLQGRMDFLQLDQRVVIEQKSGKCGFPQPDADTPVQQQQHYVQVLLYMLILRYNYRGQYERNNGALQSFLLYSKYRNSLLSLDFAPELVFNSVKVRNDIAHNEIDFARNGFRLLDTLAADSFLLNERKSNFFNRFIRPQVDGVLSPIHNATSLEKAYFYRFMRFIEVEHMLSKTGSLTKLGSGFASMWHDSLGDKLQSGNIYDNLTLGRLEGESGRVETVELHFSETQDNDMSNFRMGDIVILYPYAEGKEPDACRTLVFRCSIEDIKADTIRLRLRAPQSDPNVLKFHNYYRWAIEHDFMESSYAPLYRGMHAFLTAPQDRRDLLMLQRKPLINEDPVHLVGDYGAFNDLVRRVRAAQDFYLILGPPGSGKTSFGMLNTLKEELLHDGTSVLLLSYTNRAVDEICSKLVEAGIDFIRIGSELSCAEEYRGRLLGSVVKGCPKLADFEALLTSTRVYVGTTTAMNSHLSIFQLKQFDLAIIDEASQILEPHLMGLLCARHGSGCAIRKFVMIGDHKQLPAVVQQTVADSVVTESDLNTIHLTNCRDSLFQRLYRAYSGNPAYSHMLTCQGRMHGEIASFPSEFFYESSLQVVPTEHQLSSLPSGGKGENGIDDMLATRRTAFIAVEPADRNSSDKVNQAEADVIAAMVYRIYLRHKDCFKPTETVGVIVPYRNQIATIRNTIARRYGVDLLHDITIDTVERYQGSQRDYIIYGFTVSRRYQLYFLTSTNFIDDSGSEIDRKLNVAMTRAKEHLLIVGNPTLLSANRTYQRLIDFMSSRHSFISVDIDKFIAGEFTLPC